MKQTNKPTLRAVSLNLFPTLGSLQEVMELSSSMLPITNKNDLFSLLATHHNTLLKVFDETTLKE